MYCQECKPKFTGWRITYVKDKGYSGSLSNFALMTKAEKIAAFDPNGVGSLNGNLFGLPFSPEESDIIVIPVPWEVTVSYSTGTAIGPHAILEASPQLDVYDPELENAWQYGISMLPIPENIKENSHKLRERAKAHIDDLENDGKGDLKTIALINQESLFLKEWIIEQAERWTSKGKKVCLLGGDHSTPLGLMEFMSTQYSDFGILQIDAHADLRDAYEGFIYSHASIMFNAIQIPQVSKLVQVGIRDYCESEAQIAAQNSKVACFYDKDLKEAQFKGKTWDQLCEEMVSTLPQHVYISFDIDGLDPKYCPNTGTPVPGGFEFEEAAYLIKKVVTSGRKIISFDLNEVAPGDDEWDANVGARMLYRMCNLMIKSNSI